MLSLAPMLRDLTGLGSQVALAMIRLPLAPVTSFQHWSHSNPFASVFSLEAAGRCGLLAERNQEAQVQDVAAAVVLLIAAEDKG